MLHGLCGSAVHFDTAFRSADLAGHALLAIDLPGFGKSDSYGALSLASMSDAVVEVIKNYCDDSPWLVAHSMSASIAVGLLHEISGVTLLEGDLLPEHLVVSDTIVGMERDQYRQRHEMFQRIAPVIMQNQTRLTDIRQIHHYSSSFQDCSADAVWHTAYNANQYVRSRQTIGQLISWPGQLSYIASIGSIYEDTIELVKSALPRTQFHRIENSGHFPMIDNPTETWAAVAEDVGKG